MWSESDLCYAPNFLTVAVQTDMCSDIELVGVDQRSDVNQIVQVISIPVKYIIAAYGNISYIFMLKKT